MFIEGSKSGVGFWYVCWGASGQYNMSVYKTLNGLAKWFAGIGKGVPVYRIGRVVFTGAEPKEEESWTVRENFLEWVRPLVTFPLPK